MSRGGRELRDVVRLAVEEFDGQEVRFRTNGSSHQECRFRVAGVPLVYTFASTPHKGVRTFENTRAGVRRLCRRAIQGVALPGAAVPRAVLDAGVLLPGQPHDLRAGRARAR